VDDVDVHEILSQGRREMARRKQEHLEAS
jgi:hypothetical protein